MKKQLIAWTVSAALAATATGALAGERSSEERKARSDTNKREMIGLGSGAAIGAAAGGPVGLIIGMAVGGLMGDRMQQLHSGRAEAQQQAELASAEAASLRSVLVSNERDMARLESQLRAEQRAHSEILQEAINLQVLFRTGDSTLDPDSEARLTRIASLIRPMSGVAVHLSGHADARGDEDFNRQLSAERAAAVNEVLVRAGVPASRIVLTAEGTRYANAPTDDQDAMAMDRRVQVRLISEAESRRVAARQQ